MSDQDILLCVGTYTTRLPHAAGGSEGIYIYRLNQTSGELDHLYTQSGVVNPSYLAVDPQQRYLYAVSELDEHDGQRGGIVSAYRLDRATGALTFINQQPSHGNGPCHLSVDPSGKWLLVANYNSGSIAVYPVQADGALGEATAKVQHEGSSVNPARQEGPHAHCILADAASRYAFAVDLGVDKILIYELGADGALQPADPPAADIKAGAGPRHIVWHPDEPYLYLINELDSTIIAFAYNGAGGLGALQTLSTIPANFTEETTCAAIHITPSGKFLYGSNRGHDSLAIYAVNGNNGQLQPAGHATTGGKTPRDFAIDPTENFVVVGNQNSHELVTFRINSDTGALTATGHKVAVSSPASLLFVG